MKGYIINLYTKEKIEFIDGTGRLVLLNDVNEQKQANYNLEAVIGKNGAYAIYENTSNGVISFSLGFWFDETKKVLEIRNKFKTLVTPAIKGNLPLPPPPILLVWGSFYKIKGVVTNFQVTPIQKWDIKTGLPYGIDINLEIMEI